MRIPKKLVIDAINEVRPVELKPYIDEKIEMEIDEVLDRIREKYNIWIKYSWDYMD